MSGTGAGNTNKVPAFEKLIFIFLKISSIFVYFIILR